MAETLMSDLSTLIPSVMQPLMSANIAKYLDFMMHGVMDRVSLPAGEYVPFPGFKELSGDDDRMVDSGNYDINKIDPQKDIAVVLHRIKVFGANDLSKIVTGQDPMAAIAAQVGTYFAKVIQKAALSVLKGAFVTSGALNGTNMYSVYVDTATEGNKVKMSPAVAAAGMAKIGDELTNIAAWVMHSKVYADLLAAGYISTSTIATPYGLSATGELQSFMGKPIIMADTCHTTAGSNATSYRTYGLARGSLAYGVQKDVNPEADRDKKDKKDFISTDIHFAAHIRGLAYATAAGANPTNTTLETATSWTLAAADAKFCKIVAIDTN